MRVQNDSLKSSSFLLFISLFLFHGNALGDGVVENEDLPEAELVLARNFFDANPSGITSVGNYTLISTGTLNLGFWSSLGTEELTTRIEVIAPEGTEYRNADITSIRAINAGSLRYFPVTRPTGPVDIWVTDGTQSGTRRVVNGVALGLGSGTSGLRDMTALDDTVVFTGFVSSAGGDRLFVIDENQPAGAIQAGDFQPYHVAGSSMAAFQERIYVSSTTGGDPSLWRFNPATQGITQVWSMDATATNRQAPSQLTVADGILYFRARDDNGFALWRLNPSGVGAERLFHPDPTVPEDGDMTNATKLLAASSQLFFFTRPFDETLEPPAFRTRERTATSRGTAETTGLVWLDELGDGWSGVMNDKFAIIGNELLFRSPTTADDGRLWWLTDGTVARTRKVMILDEPVSASASLISIFDIVQGDGAAWVTNNDRDRVFRVTTDPEGRIALANEFRFADHLHDKNGELWLTSARPFGGNVDVFRFCPGGCPSVVIFRDQFGGE